MGQFKNKKPKLGFNRPSSNMSSDIKREWKNTKVQDLQLGDIISGRGIITMLFKACDDTWYVEAGEATETFFDQDTQFFAFVRKAN